MKAVILAISMAASAAACAQTWSIDQCIQYATEHNLTVRQREAGQLSAEQQVTEVKSSFLPTVNANAGQSWNIGRGLTSNNTYANRNTSSFSWGASLSLPVFQGMRRFKQLEYAKANLVAMAEQCEAAKEDITINVIANYLQALYAKEMIQVARRQVDLSSYELRRRQALLEAGKIPEADMLEADAQLAADSLSLTQATNDYALAIVDLTQLLQLQVEPADFEILPIQDPEDDATLMMPVTEIYALALERNHTIAAAKSNLAASEKYVSVARTGYMPTLNFNAGLGSSYYTHSGIAHEPFATQMRHNYATNFGLSLNIPIFDGLSTRNSVKRARISQLQAQLDLDQSQQQLYRAVQQAYQQAIGARAKLKSSRHAQASATAAFEAISEKYGLGRATPTEYEQAKTKALRATSDCVQAQYELLLRTRLLRFYIHH